MKKIVTLLLCILFLFSASVPFFGETVGVPGTSSVDLKVVYNNSSPGITVSVSPEGSASGELPDGTAFSFTDLPASASRIRVYPVQKSEEEVCAWINSCLGNGLQVVQAYYVYCTDGEGNEVSNNGGKVTLEVSENVAEKSAIYAINSSGEKVLVSSSYQDGSLLFSANGAYFYVLCETVQNSGTSDLVFPVLGAVLIVLSCSVVVVLWFRKKGKNSVA